MDRLAFFRAHIGTALVAVRREVKISVSIGRDSGWRKTSRQFIGPIFVERFCVSRAVQIKHRDITGAGFDDVDLIIVADGEMRRLIQCPEL